MYEDPEKQLLIVANFLDRLTSPVAFATTISCYHPANPSECTAILPTAN
jgi:hypothetical protein